jgi:hypothetical protein
MAELKTEQLAMMERNQYLEAEDFTTYELALESGLHEALKLIK